MALPLFPCTLVGSYPQPDWLIDRERLKGRFKDSREYAAARFTPRASAS